MEWLIGSRFEARVASATSLKDSAKQLCCGDEDNKHLCNVDALLD